MITVHADVVGSLLRPPGLLKARERLAAGAMALPAFKAVEDAAVDGAVALQESAGLEVVTDGEMRRLSFQSQMTEAVEGFADHDLDAFLWGDWHGGEDAGDWSRERPAGLGITGKLKPRRHLAAEEFTYLRARTRRIPKVCLPSPSLWANFWDAERAGGTYASLDAFLADVVDILKGELAELERLGASYVQLDAPHYTAFLDPALRSFYEQRGWHGKQWLERGIALDNAVMEGFPNLTFGFHLCRGNQASRWLVSGDYQPLAKPIFRRIRAQRLFLEFDDERSGGFEPLREVPEDKTVVLGLVTTKSARRERPRELIARIKEAARYLPLERLALSPQCGFATSVLGNRITPADQKRKLRTVVRVAGEVWG
ncbi:MAG: cobalamin-independent methionine synthase II family protein [SAR324 cluster bacterium]|nr:cobalamin-independent methionine synthase II family protein [SAR324 cluster bacterium]